MSLAVLHAFLDQIEAADLMPFLRDLGASRVSDLLFLEPADLSGVPRDKKHRVLAAVCAVRGECDSFLQFLDKADVVDLAPLLRDLGAHTVDDLSFLHEDDLVDVPIDKRQRLLRAVSSTVGSYF